MNWTEGNLARHSRGRANNEVLRRQKQHFARARSRMLSGQARQSPVAISFLNDTHKPQARAESDPSTSQQQDTNTFQSDGRPFNESRTPWRIRNVAFGQDDTREARQESASLSPWGAYQASNRKRPALAEIFNQEQANEKRRRLLEKPDWAGLEMQQPIDLVLPGQTRMSSGRRWSKIDPNTTRHSLDVQQRGHRTLSASRNYSSEHVKTFQQRPLGPIRVRIGSQSVTNTADSPDWLSSEEQMQALRMPRNRSRRYAQNEPRRGSSVSLSSGDRECSYSMISTDDASCSIQTKHEDSSKIHHPIPQRAHTSKILQWSPSFRSDDSVSVHAQIGRPKRWPPSEVAADMRWLEHIMPAENICIPLTRGSSLLESPPHRPDISPGISELLVQSSQVNHRDSEGTPVHSSSEEVRRAGYLQPVNQPSILSTAASQSITSHGIPSFEASHGMMPGATKTCKRPPQVISSIDPPTSEQRHTGMTGNPNSLVNRTKDAKSCDNSKSTKIHGKVHQSEADDNDAWMKFVFGDCEVDSHAEVFREALHEAARDLALPRTPQKAAKIAFGGDINYEVEAPQTSNQSISAQRGSEEASSNSATTSRFAIIGSPSPEQMPPIRHQGEMEEDLVTPPTNVSDDTRFTTSPIPVDVSSGSGVPPTDSPKSNEATVDGSTVSEISQQIFRFAAPRTFVGKLARSGIKPKDIPSQSAITGSRGQRRTTTGRRSKKKKWSDDRANIRELPDFDEDPIEE
ncbi:hypothetical protein PFICI_13391 [Pestalotiopsis fici W106-1]|uniref:Uncharacterized protein n=1 Tax=Pestalotiopsis fici (strain W106-1 / CGMCC3.15140) TaxID=1229662 RepID=W3WP51_PESFW|nr:uncharacterized protein PFICI_13391 [Pestalotiopsis fici W106-1]ETS74907.1 hypothetical protein PFICI_13391 [Pestalotiopsis fici W106-1]